MTAMYNIICFNKLKIGLIKKINSFDTYNIIWKKIKGMINKKKIVYFYNVSINGTTLISLR